MKALKLQAVILALLMTSGCTSAKALVKENPNKVIDVYLEAVSNGRADSADYIKENLKISQAFGYVKPYVPVVTPADVRLVWIPAHKSKSAPEVLVAGHWIYIMVKQSTWFVDSQAKNETKIPLVLPYKEENKK